MQTKILFRTVMIILAIFLVTACSKEARKARLLGEADNYFKAGNYDKAKLAYLNALRLDSQNALAFERIGAMWQDDGAPLRAAGFLKRASELDPKNVQNRIRLARCYVATGHFNDGTKEALTVLEQAPDNGDAIIILTEAARSKEDIEAAEKQLQRFPKKNDGSAYTFLARPCARMHSARFWRPAARRLSACATTDDSRGGSCPGLGVARSPHPPRLPRHSLRSCRVAGPRGTRGSRTTRSPVPPAAPSSI